MKINNAAMAYGIVTFCVGITTGVLGKFLPEFFWEISVTVCAFFGALLASLSIDEMTELKEHSK